MADLYNDDCSNLTGWTDSSRAFCIKHEDTVTTTAGSRFIPFNGHRVTRVVY